MNILFLLSITISLMTNTVIGLAVYFTNKKRAANILFFAATVCISLWLISQRNALLSTSEDWVVFWIRQATMFSVFIPCCFNLIRLAILYPDDKIREILSKAWKWFAAFSPIAILCQTDFFLPALKPIQVNEIHIPEYGPGYSILTVYFIASLIVLVARLIESRSKATGIQQTELEFTLLGSSAALFAGALFGFILPQVMQSPEMITFSPFSIIVLDGCIAYGIATSRIMGVESILRTFSAYLLLGLYLILLYFLVRGSSQWVMFKFTNSSFPLPELLSALVVAFSLAPMNGKFQKFATSMFLNWRPASIQETTATASALLQSITTVDELLGRFASLISTTYGTDSIRIYLKRDQQYIQVHPEGEESLNKLDLNHPVIKACEENNELIGADFIRRNPLKFLNADLLPAMHSLRISAAIPIRSKNQAIGILLLGSRISGRIYELSELENLEVITNQLGVALENARLYTEIQNSKIYSDILLDNMVSGVIAVNEDAKISVFNREAQRITGLSADQVLERPLSTLPEEYRTPLESTLERKIGIRDLEKNIYPNVGDPIPVRIGTSVFHSQHDDVLGALLVINDLSQIRKLEEQVKRTDRLASLGTLSAGMAHEIKNPLVTIKTFTDLLPERYEDADFRDTFSDLVGHEVNRIDAIVNQLLKFARPAKPNMITLNIDITIERCFRLIKQQLEQKNIKAELSLRAEDYQVDGDPDQLEQVFMNFFLNAIQAMDSGGEFLVKTEWVETPVQLSMPWSTQQDQAEVKVTIQDNGSGIETEHVGRIYDPFFTTKSDGTGMGLAVSFNILEDHNARVEVNSQIGEGTTFQISFPVVRTAVTS